MEENKKASQNVTLRAFRIKNPNLSTSNKGLRQSLQTVLDASQTAEQRCMLLSREDDDKEQDVISYYQSYSEQQSLFCTMLRIAPGNDVPHITSKLLNLIKFPIAQLEHDKLTTAAIYKNHYYFSVLGDFLVTAGLPMNRTVTSLQTYLAWFLKDETLEITPMVQPPKGYKLSDLSTAVFRDPEPEDKPKADIREDDTQTENSGKQIVVSQDTQAKGWLTQAALKQFLPHLLKDVKSLSDVDLTQVISAELLIKFKKPRKMTLEQYENILGASLKPIGDLDNVKYKTKDNKTSIKGRDLIKSKKVEVEKIGNAYLNEEQLMQEMAKYLGELINEDNTKTGD